MLSKVFQVNLSQINFDRFKPSIFFEFFHSIESKHSFSIEFHSLAVISEFASISMSLPIYLYHQILIPVLLCSKFDSLSGPQ